MSGLDENYVPRRVVTAIRDGKSVFLSDGPPPNTHQYQTIPGMMNSVVYRTVAQCSVDPSDDETAPQAGSMLPAPGETSLVIVTFPPDSVFARPGLDFAAMDQEQHDFAPDFADTFEKENPGKHQTDSIDYDIVLDGEIWLELDDETKHLRAGDVVIQGGTRHAWRNQSDLPATLCFVLVGATRDQGTDTGPNPI